MLFHRAIYIDQQIHLTKTYQLKGGHHDHINTPTLYSSSVLACGASSPLSITTRGAAARALWICWRRIAMAMTCTSDGGTSLFRWWLRWQPQASQTRTWFGPSPSLVNKPHPSKTKPPFSREKFRRHSLYLASSALSEAAALGFFSAMSMMWVC